MYFECTYAMHQSILDREKVCKKKKLAEEKGDNREMQREQDKMICIEEENELRGQISDCR